LAEDKREKKFKNFAKDPKEPHGFGGAQGFFNIRPTISDLARGQSLPVAPPTVKRLVESNCSRNCDSAAI
jgi:hypothetical protein